MEPLQNSDQLQFGILLPKIMLEMSGEFHSEQKFTIFGGILALSFP